MSEPEPTLEQLLQLAAGRVLDGLEAGGIARATAFAAFSGGGRLLSLADDVAALPGFLALRDDLALLYRHAGTASSQIDERKGVLSVTTRYRRELAVALPRDAGEDWDGIVGRIVAIGLAHAIEIGLRSRVPASAREALAALLARSLDGQTVPVEEVRRMMERVDPTPPRGAP